MKVDIDTTGLSFVNGLVEGMSAGITRDSFLDAALDLTHEILNGSFQQWMDLAAAASPKNLTHVYEWGQIGLPQGRLWESLR